MSEIKAATKFLGNSQFKQLCHITSELFEVWCAWAVYKWNPTLKNLYKLCLENVDLQSSVQTNLEGPLCCTKSQINALRSDVEVKNCDRNYYSQQSAPD